MPSKSSVLVFHADPDPKIGFGSDINKKVASDNGLCGPTINDSGSEESAQVQEVAEQAAAESGAAAGPESAEPGAAEQAATAEAARVKEAEAEAERAAQQPTAGRAGLLQQLQDSTNRLKLRKSTAPKNRRPVQDQDPVDNQAIRRAELFKAIKTNANAGDKSAVKSEVEPGEWEDNSGGGYRRRKSRGKPRKTVSRKPRKTVKRKLNRRVKTRRKRR